MNYWTSTNSGMRFRDPIDDPEIERILREAPIGLDPQILADEIGKSGFSATHVRAYQRRLGLRTIIESNGRKSKRSGLDTRGRNKKKPK